MDDQSGPHHQQWLLPPAGAVRSAAASLWLDGLPANGATRPWDAFGVWAR